jgi:hypothetical protein
MTSPEAATLAFYASAAPMTELPSDRSSLGDLPRDVGTAANVARGVLVHRDWAPGLGLHFDEARLADQHVRPVQEIVRRVHEIVPAPLTEERPLGDRMVGVCRHFTTLHVALLRDAGIPARGRVGFARYFGGGWNDHWVTEWWNGEAWTRTDAQVGPLAAKLLNLTFDPAVLPEGEFLSASEAWMRCRAGTEDPEQFGIFDIRGLGFIAGSITQDVAALNKVELLPWDIWGTLSDGPQWKPTAGELAHVDDIAELVERDDLGELQKRFTEPDVAIPLTITTIVDGAPVPVEIDRALVTVA